jgi:glucosyl-3-phosphoglycerate phosphatase
MQLIPRSDRPRRLVLLRHGRTEWNATGRAQGHADVSLDDVGRLQAANAARNLATYEPAYLWSSDLARARETAEAVAARTGLGIELDKRLREIDVGVRQGLTFEEFGEAYPDLLERFRAGERVVVPGAEDVAQVAERVVAAFADAIRALDEGETGIVVGHGASLRIGLLALFEVPDRAKEMLAGMANCAWAVVEEHHDRGWQIIDYNAQTLPEPPELADDLSTA